MKLIKKSKTKIKCVRDEESKLEVTPEELGMSDSLNDANVSLLSMTLEKRLSEQKPPHLFDFLNDINEHKQCLVDDEDFAKAYQPFITNRILSFARDCIFYVNEVNVRHDMPKTNQYKYLMNSIRKKRRYIKTHKDEVNPEIDCLRFLFGIGEREAHQYLQIIINELGSFPKELLEDIQILRDKKGLINR